MLEQLNDYKQFVLDQLNLLPLQYRDTNLFQNFWMRQFLSISQSTLEAWESELITEGYVSVEPIVFFQVQPTIPRIKIEQKGRHYLAQMQRSFVNNPKPEPQDNTTRVQLQEQLKCLSGKWQGKDIMPRKDFEKLLDYVQHLLETGTLPKDIKCMQRTNISGKFIRYTFYLLHKRNKSQISKEKFITFLHAVFSEFENCAKSTTSGKFSCYENGNYKSDKESITYSLSVG